MEINVNQSELLNTITSQIDNIKEEKENSNYARACKGLEAALNDKWIKSEYKDQYGIDLTFDRVEDLMFIEIRYIDPYSDIFDVDSYRYWLGETLFPSIDKISKYYKLNNSEYSYELYNEIISDVKSIIKLRENIKTTKYETQVEIVLNEHNGYPHSTNKKITKLLNNDLINYLNNVRLNGSDEYKYCNIYFNMNLNSLVRNEFIDRICLKEDSYKMVDLSNIPISINDTISDYESYKKSLVIKDCYKPVNEQMNNDNIIELF